MNALRNHPELAIFLVLAVGFVIGRIRIGSFKVGNVVGTLIAGIVTGYVRSIRPLFGRVPDAAISFMQALGLAGKRSKALINIYIKLCSACNTTLGSN